MTEPAGPVRLWGGRFERALDASVVSMSSTALEAWRLVPYDVAQCRAHAQALHGAGVLSDAERDRMLAALDEVSREARTGELAPVDGEEDIHSAVERRLIDKLGELGGKLRAGRSRNDQAATDLRLYLRDAVRRIAAELAALESALIDQAERHPGAVLPGMTHLQHAQPVPLAQQLLAHAQPLARDAARLRDWDRRAAVSPLGAAALAGTTLAIDPTLTARLLGFDASAANSIDAVADRDFVAEIVFALALVGVHVSRLAEELILWASQEFAWIELDDAFATGSSIMPQKKNPDVAEIARGRCGRLIGDLAGFLATLKGLPLAYNRDMQEDKHVAFDAVDTALAVLPAMSGMVRTLSFHTETMAAAAELGFTLATDVAERLVVAGVPFRRAHEIVGRLVAAAVRRGCELQDLPTEVVAVIAEDHDDVLAEPLSADAAVRERRAPGATAPDRVREQLAALRGDVDAQLAWATAAGPFRLGEAPA